VVVVDRAGAVVELVVVDTAAVVVVVLAVVVLGAGAEVAGVAGAGLVAGGAVAGGAVGGGAVAGGAAGADRKEMAALASCERSPACPDTALVFTPQGTWRQSVAPKRPTTERRVANDPLASVVTFWRPTELQVWSSAEDARHSITNRAVPGRNPLPRTTTI
jgi:hypothetical protein